MILFYNSPAPEIDARENVKANCSLFEAERTTRGEWFTQYAEICERIFLSILSDSDSLCSRVSDSSE